MSETITTVAELRNSGCELMALNQIPRKVEYFQPEGRNTIPKLQFTWREDRFVSMLPSEYNKLNEAEQETLTLDKSDRKYYGWAAGKELSATLCNFRRYGWSWTRDRDGEYGYGAGGDMIWVNQTDAGFWADCPTQIIRETLATILARGVSELEIPQDLVYGHEVKPVVSELAREACANPLALENAGKAVRNNNGLCTSGKLTVLITSKKSAA